MICEQRAVWKTKCKYSCSSTAQKFCFVVVFKMLKLRAANKTISMLGNVFDVTINYDVKKKNHINSGPFEKPSLLNLTPRSQHRSKTMASVAGGSGGRQPGDNAGKSEPEDQGGFSSS